MGPHYRTRETGKHIRVKIHPPFYVERDCCVATWDTQPALLLANLPSMIKSSKLASEYVQ